MDQDYHGIFSDECDAVYNDQFGNDRSYWSGVKFSPNSYFSIDLKVQVHINKVIVRNSPNSKWDDR